MKRLITYLSTLAILIAMTLPSQASHIAGADLSYECLGNGVYMVKLDLTRDCSGIPAPTIANVSAVTTGCGTQNIQMQRIACTPVTGFCNLGTTTCNGGTLPGFERCSYQGIITLPSTCGIADLSYSVCCRNTASTNVQNAGSQDLYISAQINTTLCSDGPAFNNPSSLVVCDGQATSIALGGTDADGDSIVYSLVAAKGSGGTPLSYNIPLSATNPLATSAPIILDPNTGVLTFTPAGIQAGIIAVRADEYRNGVKIGEANRDLLVYVVNCTATTNVPPQQISGPSNILNGSLVSANHVSVCAGDTLSFQIAYSDSNALDSLYYQLLGSLPAGASIAWSGWNPLTLTVSMATSAAGTYYIPLRVLDNGCPVPGQAVTTLRIDVLSGTSAGPDQTICTAGGTVQLQAIGGTSFTWTPSTGLSNANIANPLASPSVTTTYVVTSNLSGGCSNTDTVTVHVNPSSLWVQAMNDTNYCSGDSIIYLNATSNSTTASWSYFGQPFATTLNTTYFNNGQGGPFVVTVYDTNGCSVSDTVNVGITNIQVTATVTPEICSGQNGSITAIAAGGTPPYTYLWSNGQTTATINGLSTGTYSVTVIDANGCAGYFTAWVQNQGVFLNAFYQGQGLCVGDTGLVYLSGSVWGNTVTWTPNTDIDSISPSQYWVYPSQTTSYIFTVSDSSGCSVSDTLTINVSPAFDVDLGGDTTLCGVNVLDLFASTTGGSGTAWYSWNTTAGTLDTFNSATNRLTANGPGIVFVTASDSGGCFASDQIYVDLDSACYSYLGGRVYADQNGDCVADTNDLGIPNVMIEATDGNISIFDFTDVNGDYNFQVGNGSWDIIQHAPAYYAQICPAANHNVLIGGPGTVLPNLHFYDTLQGVNDLRIYNNLWVIRPGFQRWGFIYVWNDGNTYRSGNIELTHPAGVTMVWNIGYTPDAYNSSTRVASWNFSNLAPGAYIRITYQYVGDTNLTIPQNLPFLAEVNPIAGDATPANNVDLDSIPVSNSYDPNDKSVTPAGNGPDGEITIDQTTLQYRIRFQNTGNDTAYLVVLRDTLDEDLNVESINLIGSSHDFDARIDSNRVLTFRFEDIDLVDSATDEQGSQGFVLFEIGIDNPQIGTVVKNQAAIYFDFNPPIFTNTTVNTIVEKSVGIFTPEESNFELFPNPTREDVLIRSLDGSAIHLVKVFDLAGSMVNNVHTHGESQYRLNCSEMPGGVYLVEVETTDGHRSVQRLVVE